MKKRPVSQAVRLRSPSSRRLVTRDLSLRLARIRIPFRTNLLVLEEGMGKGGGGKFVADLGEGGFEFCAAKSLAHKKKKTRVRQFCL